MYVVRSVHFFLDNFWDLCHVFKIFFSTPLLWKQIFSDIFFWYFYVFKKSIHIWSIWNLFSWVVCNELGTQLDSFSTWPITSPNTSFPLTYVKCYPYYTPNFLISLDLFVDFILLHLSLYQFLSQLYTLIIVTFNTLITFSNLSLCKTLPNLPVNGTLFLWR